MPNFGPLKFILKNIKGNSCGSKIPIFGNVKFPFINYIMIFVIRNLIKIF